MQDREQIEDLLHRPGDVIPADEGPHFEVFLDRHTGEDILCLRHKPHAAKNAFLRFQARDILAFQQYPAFPQSQHAEHRLHRGRFAGSVRADHHGDLARLNPDRASMQDIGAAIAADHLLTDQEAHDTAPARGRFFRPVPR